MVAEDHAGSAFQRRLSVSMDFAHVRQIVRVKNAGRTVAAAGAASARPTPIAWMDFAHVRQLVRVKNAGRTGAEDHAGSALQRRMIALMDFAHARQIARVKNAGRMVAAVVAASAREAPSAWSPSARNLPAANSAA